MLRRAFSRHPLVAALPALRGAQCVAPNLRLQTACKFATVTTLNSETRTRDCLSREHGRHLKVLGYGDPKALGDAGGVSSGLTSVIESLGMRLLGGPYVSEVEVDIRKLGCEPFEDEGGVTAVAVLSTSHCTVHTWPLRRYFVMDIYSCRDFAVEPVERLLGDLWGAERLKITDLSESLVPPAGDSMDMPSASTESVAVSA